MNTILLQNCAVFADEFGLVALLEGSAQFEKSILIVDPHRLAAKTIAENISKKLSCSVFLHDQELKNKLFTARPELGLVFSYSKIIKKDLIQLFPKGIINIHFGKLPQFRGANPLQWTLIENEKKTASTLHYIDEGIDTGPIISEKLLTIHDKDTAVTLQSQLKDLALLQLQECLPLIKKDKIVARPQPTHNGRTWHRRRPEDGMIDWNWPDEKIRNYSRALLSPWPGILFMDRNQKLHTITRALSLDEIQHLRREFQEKT